jgi:RNA-directed DNA polymerase
MMAPRATPQGMESSAGAASHESESWHSIGWYQAQRVVRRLQARIVQATQQGRWGKVKALQHLLTHSYSAKVLAVRRVTDNQGHRTPGVDQVLWNTPEEKMQAVHHLRQHGYQPQPLRRIYIPKSNGKMRPLSIATMQDRAMQAVYLQALDPVAEVIADRNSYGFRVARSAADAIGQCFITLGRRNSAQWILEGDIRACFDEISHAWLLQHIPLDKTMLEKWLSAGYVDHGVLHPTDEGAAQGGPLSPVLANLTLNGLEGLLREHFPKRSHHGSETKVNFVRFADDFIVTGPSKEVLEHQVKPLIEGFLRERGLVLSPEKTVITPIEDGFDFLGQNVRKYHGKLLITPSRKNVQAFLTKVRTTIKGHKQITAGRLILLLNPLIRGWALYHRHVVSKATFAGVDNAIFHTLWQWAVRRHPGKNRAWIRGKYFQTRGENHWVFTGDVPGPKGTSETVWLFSAGKMPIVRHVKVREQANPYDPWWELYFEERLGLKMAGQLPGRRKLLYLWEQQAGICPVCKQKITSLTGWHNHHIVWRSKGGSDSAENRVLLHPHCHEQVHDQGLTVVKPRPPRGVREA